MDFIFSSDLHLTGDIRDNEKQSDLISILADKYPNHKKPILGDITNDGIEEQYEVAEVMLAPIKDDIMIVPGNHDYCYAGNFYNPISVKHFDKFYSGFHDKKSFIKYYDMDHTFFGKDLPVLNFYEDEKILIISLDTNLETEHPFDFACGEVGKEQLNFLDTILSAKEPDVTTLLFFHHHPFVRFNPFKEMLDARDLIKICYGRVDVMAFGHEHNFGYSENCVGIKHIISCGKTHVDRLTVQMSITEGNIEANVIEF